ncbi:MAG TPA: hypothetical protein DCG19_11715 [Cryomorphaceae bacterium]|nr:hypothetical protein [Owenweeksia sp.]HAD98066.1 hypothetical protein [Cryomorphaceae bacterium]HBF20542.1 hypothetical protein [Cryomorphaceae bacterium]HCQ15046.1 hypothetical protein [Cryomorphaceae bacterium]
MGCDKYDGNPYSYDQQSIFSESGDNLFREFVLLLKPYILENGERRYVVCDSLLEVEIHINGREWGEFASLDIDAQSYDPTTFQGYKVSNSEVKYAVIAPYALPEDTLQTAGEFAGLINSLHILKPGDYIAEVPKFKIRRADGGITTVRANITEWVRVTENSTSAFIGEFEIAL